MKVKILRWKRMRAIILTVTLVMSLQLAGSVAVLWAQEPKDNHTNHAGFPAVYPPPDAPPEIPSFILPFQGPSDPETIPLRIEGGDWTLSPDGKKVIFVSVVDHNLWLINLP